MEIKNQTASKLYDLMLRTNGKRVANSAMKAMDAIQSDSTEDQLLAVGALLVCLLNQYELNHVDVL